MKTAQILPVERESITQLRIVITNKKNGCNYFFTTGVCIDGHFAQILANPKSSKNEKYQLNFFKLRSVSLDFLKVASFQTQLGID